jgi:hypothetical protein
VSDILNAAARVPQDFLQQGLAFGEWAFS